MVGTVPNLTGSATETGLRTDFSTGLGKVGSVMPTYGKVLGAGMVIKSTSKLKKVGLKAIKIKGARSL